MNKMLFQALSGFVLLLPPLLLSADISSVAFIACSNSGIDQEITAKTHGKVYFNEGKIGEIVLFCHVSEALHGKTIINMELSARSGIPFHRGSIVSAALRRVNKLSGITTSVPGAVIDSEDEVGCRYHSNEVKFCDKSIQPYLLDFTTYYYFYQVNLKRTHPTQDVHGIGLSVRTQRIDTGPLR